MRTALLIGILSGLCVGLVYAWLIAPVEFVTADPYHVSPIYRDVWIVMAAEAHAAGADWDRTTARLTGLRDPNLPETLAAAYGARSPRVDPYLRPEP